MDWDELISASALIDIATILVLCGIGVVFFAVRKTGVLGRLSEEFQSDVVIPRSLLRHTWVIFKADGQVSEWDGFTLLGVVEDALLLTSALPSPFGGPMIRIPLDLLEKVGAKPHLLFGLKKFDEFKIRDADCNIFLPTGLVELR